MAAPASLNRTQTAIYLPSQKSTNYGPTNSLQYKIPNATYDAGFRGKPRTVRKNNPNSGPTVKIEGPMSATTAPEAENTRPRAAIDPISKQILERTHSQHKVTQQQNNAASAYSGSGRSDEPNPTSRANTDLDTESLGRVDTGVSTKPAKDKKNRVSFLSRIIGGKKRDEDVSVDYQDSMSEMQDTRPLGYDAEVFSQPIGYVPKFPAPPRYIRVKAQNRKRRDLDRLFLAQVLSESQKPRSAKTSIDIDAKIHGIGETPAIPPPNSSKTANNAIWASEFSKDGQYFAAGGQDKLLRVWRVISTKEDREAEEALSQGTNDNEEHVKLNAPVFKQELVREYDGHTSAILDLSWSKNNFLLSSSMDKTVRLYHVSRSECLCAFKHNDFVTSIQFHPRDDRFFLAGSLDSKIRLWSIPDKNVAYAAQVQDMVTAVAFTPDGKTAIAGTLSGLCILYDVDGLKAHSQIHVRSNRGKNAKGSKITGIDTIAIPRLHGQSDIKILITSNDSRVRVYNLRDRSLEAKYRGNENTSSQIRATFSDDGKFIICGSEDKRVYVWPTGPLERQDGDKRPFEVFEAHSSIVTTALLAPVTTRRLLAQSGDPLYDLCNPPPVRLYSRAESVASSKGPTHHSGSDEHPKSESPPVADESPQYLARHSHVGGHIIVTADYSGQIKVFRQDCAYQKRREGSWDNTSSLSRKIRGRSGSLATKTSGSSMNNRQSMNFGSKNPSTDHIIDWRNSVLSAKNASAATSVSDIHTRTSLHSRERSVSPGKRGLAHRFSLRHSSTPVTRSSEVSAASSRRNSLAQPNSTSASPGPNTTRNTESPHYYSASEHRRSSVSHASTDPPPKFALNDDIISSPQMSTLTEVPSPGAEDRIINEDGNILHLVGSQSYMAWDYKHTILPMMNAQPRTPGVSAGSGHNPLSREQSFISQLSSERMSSGPGTPNVDESHLSDTEDPTLGAEELKCKRCGSENFLMYKDDRGRTSLRCRTCSAPVS